MLYTHNSDGVDTERYGGEYVVVRYIKEWYEREREVDGWFGLN